MAFKNANMIAHMVKFNSATSSDFLAMYSELVENEIKLKGEEPKQQTFAPSQMRCDRVSWFRLRGTQPDKISNPDTTLNFTAEIGTACHQIIQNRLMTNLGANWIEVQDWISKNPELFKDYEMTIEKSGFESRIDMKKPYPIRFACDGLINFNGQVRLLEIKTSEFSSLNDLVEPKPKHIDQVKCYATMLHISSVLFLYVDRQYGSLKCFEVTVDEVEQERVKKRLDRVLELVEANIAPEGLPIGDPDCTQNMCPYYRKCGEWGR